MEERANLLGMHSTAGDFCSNFDFLVFVLINFLKLGKRLTILPSTTRHGDLSTSLIMLRLHVSSFVVVMMPG